MEKSGIMKYMQFPRWIPERKVTRILMDEFRRRQRSLGCDLMSIRESIHRENNGFTKALSFIIKINGKRMLAIFLFQKARPNCTWCMRREGYLWIGLYCTVCLFSDDYFYISNEKIVYDLFQMKVEWDKDLYSDLFWYDDEYPKSGLGPYLRRYEKMCETGETFEPLQMNFLIALLGQYNKGWELLVKADLQYLLEYMVLSDSIQYRRSKREKRGCKPSMLTVNPDSFNNFKEWLGVSNRVLVNLNNMLRVNHAIVEDEDEVEDIVWLYWKYDGEHMEDKCVPDQELFARLSDIQKYNSAYLNLPYFSMGVMAFFMENHFIHKRPENDKYPIQRTITGIARMKDKEILKIIRYLVTLEYEEVTSYFSYLHYCGKCKFKSTKEYPYGLRPAKDKLYEAARLAKDLWVRLQETQIEQLFRKQVEEDPLYHYYVTKSTGIKSQTDYFICKPECAMDLYRESLEMRNCVDRYITEVAHGNTHILFLRESRFPDRSFVTLEVENNILIQAKAFANTSPPEEAQVFIIEWAREKGIRIDCRDLYIYDRCG